MAGCRTYQPRPLDLAAHREAWLARAADAPEVAEFARRLAEREGPPQGPLDPADGLSVHEGEIVALVYNPDLRIARLRAGVTRAAADHAGLWDDPELGFEVGRMLEDASKPWRFISSAMLTLPISGRLEAERARAGAEHAAALLRIHEQEWQTRMELRRAWARWSALSDRADVEREHLSRLERLVGLVEGLERAGEMPRIEAALFRIELATRRSSLDQTIGQRDAAALEIRRILGLTPDSELVLIPGVPRAVTDIDPADASWVERHPTLAAAAAEYQTAERTLALEIRRQYPDLSIGPGFESDRGDEMVMIGLSLPIPLWNRNRQGIATAEAQREAARAAYEIAYERLVNDLAAARVEHRTARQRRDVLEREIVPLVDEQYAAARRIAELGEVDTFLLLESVSRQREAMLDLIEAQLEERIAEIRLQELVGPTTPTGGQP